jgi:hypothetical protein
MITYSVDFAEWDIAANHSSHFVAVADDGAFRCDWIGRYSADGGRGSRRGADCRIGIGGRGHAGFCAAIAIASQLTTLVMLSEVELPLAEAQRVETSLSVRR